MHPHYVYIENAIQYLKTHFKERPDLERVASFVGLSSFHFQRVFQEWAGISPKQFLHYIQLQEARKSLRQELTLFEATEQAGLSSTGRLHDLFIKLEKMSPGEYKNGAADLIISYSTLSTRFGPMLVAATNKGICQMDFLNSDDDSMMLLRANFPKASLKQEHTLHHTNVQQFFENTTLEPFHIRLHLKATDFQFQVWEALLRIPERECSTYLQIAQQIDRPTASRAVGTAIGSNLVALLIPCHRVIRGDQGLGGYKWGLLKKSVLLSWEALHQISALEKTNLLFSESTKPQKDK